MWAPTLAENNKVLDWEDPDPPTLALLQVGKIISTLYPAGSNLELNSGVLWVHMCSSS